MMDDSALATVKEWIKTAAEILGVNAEPSDDGIVTLVLGNDLVVAIELPEEGSYFTLYSPLGELPKGDVEQALLFCQKALELNAFQGQTRGGSLGLIPGQPVVVYSLVRGIEGCDAQIFAETLALFYEAALELRTLLNFKA